MAQVISGQTTGTLCYDADFYPFGGERAYTNICTQNYKFTGKERDGESGNDYFGARYYASSMGRFLTPDDGSDQDGADPQSWNLYGYVRNNPLRYTDPSGNTCASDGNGGTHDVDGPGPTCAQIAEADKNAQAAATVTATPLPTELEYMAAYRMGMGQSNAMGLVAINSSFGPINRNMATWQILGIAAFNTAELSIAEALEGEGFQVEPVEAIQGQKNPDAVVTPPGGVPGKAEFKTVTVAGPNTLKNQIQEGLKQAPTVIVDARGTSITKAEVVQQIQRVEGNMGSVQGRVIVLTNEGIVNH
jgi:RHS repeat-associated protein